MLRFIVPAIVCVVGALARRPLGTELTTDYSYEQYCEDHHKRGSAEGRARFEARLASIVEHNADPARGYVRGVNRFTDEPAPPKGRSRAAAAAAAAADAPHRRHLRAFPAASLPPASAFPPELDWRARGAVTPVKQQGECGSCWAFGSTATVESHLAIASGVLTALSPQQLVACAPNDDDCGGYGGCAGSVPELAFGYVAGAPGLASEWWIPYVSGFGTSNGTTMVYYDDDARGRG